MRMSVVVCTYQRADVLARSLGSLTDQTLSDDAYEVLVVYDQQDVETGATVDEYAPDLPNLRRLNDDGQGLSYARNVGYRAADGEYVAFLDDDASAHPGWLAAYLETFNRVTPTPDCIGGAVRPDFEKPVPWWVPPSLPGIPVRDLSGEPRWIDFPDETVIGANMAFPRSFLVETGGFPTNLGRKDGTLLSNEETVVQAAAAAGNGIYYHPDAWVNHLIEGFRLTPTYLVRRHYWQGISDCRMDPKRVADTESEAEGRSLREGIPRAISVIGGLLLSGKVSSYVMAALWACYSVGYARERVAQTRDRFTS
jgi:glycosyltransferase involved in cell wall biosynthesis